MIDLNQPLAPDSAADEYDVRRMKKALNRLGFYMPYHKAGITGITDDDVFAGIRAYQTSRGLHATGQVKPDDETMEALNADLAVAPDGYYIWRTVGDDKVRGAHKEYEGMLRAWRDAPDPGEDYNCRCWAEAVEPDDPRLYPDAIHPTIGPFDFMGGGAALRSGVAGATLGIKIIAARSRDVKWITEAPLSKIQHIFKEAHEFGILGNSNKHTLSKLRQALEKHVKSFDTAIIKGSYHNKPATHYFNKKNKLNIIRDKDGNLVGAWKLSDDQIFHVLKNGKLGGSK
jgi:hypothetical protein